MDELEAIRQKKMQEMQNEALNNQFQQESMINQQLEQAELIVKQKMTKEAIQRYTNIKLAHPEKAVHALMVMARALESKQVTQINDDLLKHFLGALTAKKKEFNIKRI